MLTLLVFAGIAGGWVVVELVGNIYVIISELKK